MSLNLRGRSFLTIKDFSREELEEIISQGERLKLDYYTGKEEKLLSGKSIGVIFEKPSTRTRVSFAVAIYELGAQALILDTSNMQLKRGETVGDTAKVLSRYLHGIVARVYAHKTLEDLRDYGEVPVINALSDFTHPCQIMGDLLTIKEKKGKLSGIKVAYLGDGNNVCHSILFGGAKFGMHVTVATPAGYEPDTSVINNAEQFTEKSGGSVLITNNAEEAVKNADVIYTDVWASMGEEAKHDERVKVMKPYQINNSIVEKAKKDVIVMHCLPAHREEEITNSVIDGAHSVVFDQAENRLHIQKAILSLLI